MGFLGRDKRELGFFQALFETTAWALGKIWAVSVILRKLTLSVRDLNRVGSACTAAQNPSHCFVKGVYEMIKRRIMSHFKHGSMNLRLCSDLTNGTLDLT